jgi:hypothetical protein
MPYSKNTAKRQVKPNATWQVAQASSQYVKSLSTTSIFASNGQKIDVIIRAAFEAGAKWAEKNR